MEEIDLKNMKFINDDEINPKVSKVISELIKELKISFNPRSIIIFGSFGKGEATVIEDCGKLKFLSDCEIILIPPYHILKRKNLKQFHDNNQKRFGLDISISGVMHSIYFLGPYFISKMPPTMENFDLKFGSKVAYGENYIINIPEYNPLDISYWEGIRLLFNRMIESIDHFSYENPGLDMLFWTDKLVLACQDALLLISGNYRASYKQRNLIFNKIFNDCFNSLQNSEFNLLEMANEATNRKLMGIINMNDPIKYWFDVADMLDMIFRYIIKKEMGIEFSDYIEFQRRYIKKLNLNYSSNLLYNLKVYIKQYIIYRDLNYLGLFSPWNQLIFSSIPLLYFSLSRDLIINKDYLECIRRLIGPNANSKDIPTSIDYYHKKELIYMWKMFC